MSLEEVLSGIRESNEKWLVRLIGKLNGELVERIEFLGPLGPAFPRAIPIELKGIAV